MIHVAENCVNGFTLFCFIIINYTKITYQKHQKKKKTGVSYTNCYYKSKAQALCPRDDSFPNSHWLSLFPEMGVERPSEGQ